VNQSKFAYLALGALRTKQQALATFQFQPNTFGNSQPPKDARDNKSVGSQSLPTHMLGELLILMGLQLLCYSHEL
jgi:hypothetical protein